MKILLIFNHKPYDTTDVTWNGLRLAGKLIEAGKEVRIFLMNDFYYAQNTSAAVKSRV